MSIHVVSSQNNNAYESNSFFSAGAGEDTARKKQNRWSLCILWIWRWVKQDIYFYSFMIGIYSPEGGDNFLKEPLIKSGASRLRWKIVRFKAQIARNSPLLRKFATSEVDNLAQADCGEKLSGARRGSHVKPAIVKIYNTEPGDFASQDVAPWFDQRFLDWTNSLYLLWFSPWSRGAHTRICSNRANRCARKWQGQHPHCKARNTMEPLIHSWHDILLCYELIRGFLLRNAPWSCDISCRWHNQYVLGLLMLNLVSGCSVMSVLRMRTLFHQWFIQNQLAFLAAGWRQCWLVTTLMQVE